jgi:membrane protein involved in colicin uptake
MDHEIKKKQEVENEKLRKAEEERLKNLQAKAAADAAKVTNQTNKVAQNETKLPPPKVYAKIYLFKI